MRHGARNVRIDFTAGSLTHFGGVYLLHLFLQQIQLRSFLVHTIRFSQRNHQYSLSEIVIAHLYPMILGLEKIEVSALLKANGTFQYLTGLPDFPNPTTLRRFLVRGAEGGLLSQIRDAHDTLRRHFLCLPDIPSSFWLNADSTVRTLYGHQEGAEKGYNPAHRGKRSYHPLLVTEARCGGSLAGILRPGNASAADGIQELVGRAYRILPHHARLRLRADSGFYDGKFVEFLRKQGISFAIVARLTKLLKSRVAELRYRKVNDRFSVADFRYQPFGWKQKERIVVLRRKVPDDPDEQLTLFTLDRYAYSAIVTDLDLQPYQIFQFYADRAALERIIRILKDDYIFGSAPTNAFEANALYAEFSLLAYDLMIWFKRLCLPEDWQSFTLPTIRHRLLMIPGAFVKSNNIPTLRLPENCLYQDVFRSAQARIKRLHPLL
jgi:hypothetical protein